MRVSSHGVAVDLPTGWEARMGALSAQGVDSPATVSAQLANFPLKPSSSDFGADIVETMRSGDALIVLFEYERSSVGTALFAEQTVPSIGVRDFTPDHLQHGVPGQSGIQRFFQTNGRAFCLYAVVGSHIDRADVIGDINEVLATLQIS